MSPLRCVTFLVLLLGANAAASKAGGHMTANPIRKIVTMLQLMVKKVEAEGEKEAKIFDDFMCYCNNGATALESSIDAGEDKIPQVESTLEKTTAEKTQLEADVKKHKSDREAAKKAMAEATEIRAKEAAAFAKESTEDKTNMAAMEKAIGAMSAGASAAFLQTSEASVLKNFALNGELSDENREAITSFLTNSNADDDEESGTGEIVGILKQQMETMGKELAEAEKAEAAAVASFNELMAAKTKEIESATAGIEDKVARIGEAAVALVNIKEDLEDTQAQVADDKKFLGDLDNTCATRKKEYAEATKLRQQELLALADTIKMLNSDEALELFKKSLPGSSSLLQITVTQHEMMQDAKQALKSVNSRDPRLEFISLALHGKKVDMSKVIKMIDDMVALLEEEQTSDDEKKEYCEAEFDTAEDEAKAVKRSLGKLSKAIAENVDTIDTLKTEIEALSAGIATLDKQVARATEMRQEENEDYKMNMAGNTACVELIGMAKDRMNKFYNPTLALPQTSAKTKNLAEYRKQSDAGQGVIGMMDDMIADIKKEIQEAEFEEKDAQEEYEGFMADSKTKRSEDSKAIADKSEVLADTESELASNKEAEKVKKEEKMANEMKVMKLHGECDFLTESYSERKMARSAEIDGLKKGKAVLSGADYALLQSSAHRHLRKISRKN
jgi:hypothetical protein